MPRIVEYPRASLQASLELAEAVDALGGSCTEEMCASRMGRKVGGAFGAMVAAAAKYGLIENKKSRLAVTELFRDYKLAYNDQDRLIALKVAFTNVPAFSKLFERFEGKKLPEDILDRLLIREFEVPDNIASRVGQYFIEGTKLCDLIEPDGTLKRLLPAAGGERQTGHQDALNLMASPARETLLAVPPSKLGSDHAGFTVTISGPGMNTAIQINSKDDLAIVNVILAKVGKSFDEVEEMR